MKRSSAGLFSATQTEAVQELARAGLRNAIRVNVAVRALQGEASTSGAMSQQRTPLGLHISYQICESTEKLAKLIHFLQVNPPGCSSTVSQAGCNRPDL